MTYPKQTLNVRDPGLGVSTATSDIPIISGIATGGSKAVNTLQQINDLSLVRAEVGYGPLAEDVALQLLLNGGPVFYVKHDPDDTGKALSAAALTKLIGTGPSITATGTPNDRYNLRVLITAGGVLATSKFQFSLDAHDADFAPFTFSQERPTVASYVIPNSGLTLTFPAGTYVAGDTYTLTCVPLEPTITDLADVALLLQNNSAVVLYLWLVSGSQPSATTGAALAGAFQSDLVAMTNSFRYMRGFIDVGSDDSASNVNTQALTWNGSRVSPGYGYTLDTSALPFEGFATRKISMSSIEAIRAFGELISSDLSRTASGSLDNVRKIFFDGFYDQTVDTSKVSTMRTWSGMAGYYLSGGKLKSAFGSDFTDVQFGRVMDRACRTTFEAQFPYQSAAFRTIASGAIDPRDAKRVETDVNSKLSDQLLVPNNAEGYPGHVSALKYAIDLLWNLNTTGQLKTSVGMRPLGYAKIISTDLFFTLNP